MRRRVLGLNAESLEDLRVVRMVGRLLLAVGEHGGAATRSHHQAAAVLVAVTLQVTTQVQGLQQRW